MIGCLRTHVRKQPIIALYFESENELKFYNLEASASSFLLRLCAQWVTNFKHACALHADSGDADQTDLVPRLI